MAIGRVACEPPIRMNPESICRSHEPIWKRTVRHSRSWAISTLLQTAPPVTYAGSPCPLDINETGLRRFLILDTDALEITSQRVDSPQIFFSETIVMLPVEDERAFLEAEIEKRIRNWNLPEGWEDRVRQRLSIVGYAAERPAVEAMARDLRKDYAFFDDGPDISELNHAVDTDRIHIAQQVQQWIEDLDWPEADSEPTKEEIALEALRVIWEN